ARAGDREAQGVVDAAVLQVLVAREAGEDRQPGGVGRGPGLRPQVVRVEAPDRPRSGTPGRLPGLRRVERVQLVEAAGVAVDDDRVAIAGRVAAALDRHVLGDRVRALIRLARVLELHAHLVVVVRDGRVGDPERLFVVDAGAGVGVAARA